MRTRYFYWTGLLAAAALTSLLVSTAHAEDPRTAKGLTDQQKNKLKEREALWKQGQQLKEEGKLSEAVIAWEKMVEVTRAALGDDHVFMARSIHNLATLHQAMGDYQKAEPLYTRALKIYEDKLGPSDTETDTCLHQLAMMYQAMGDFTKAEPLFARALQIREKQFGADHPNTATTVSYLAVLYKTMKSYGKAEPLYIRAIKIYEDKSGLEHPRTATGLSNLAVFYHDIGNYAKAEPLFLRAVNIREKMLGPDHLDTIASLNHLALLYSAMSDYPKAEAIYIRLLKAREDKVGLDHLDTTSILTSLAMTYQSMADYGKAESLFARTVRIRENKLGPDHLDTAASLRNLGMLYRVIGDHIRAEPLLARSLKIVEGKLGPHHLHTAGCLFELAKLHHEKADYTRAEQFYARSMNIYESKLPDQPAIAYILDNRATLYRDMGEHARAEPLYTRALKIREDKLGVDHIQTASTLNYLGMLHSAIGDYVKAEQFYMRALKIYEEKRPGHDSTSGPMNNLALLYQKMGDHAKAESLYTRALKTCEDKLGSDHSNTASILTCLGSLYSKMGDHAKAESLLTRALKIREDTLGPDHPDTAGPLSELGNLYLTLGDFAKAQQLYSRALKITEGKLGVHHRATAHSLEQLAGLYHFLGDDIKAEPMLRRSVTITRRHLELTAGIQSERQQRLIAEKNRSSFNAWLSITLDAKVVPAEVFAEMLAWKGAVTGRQMAQRAMRQALEAPSDSEALALFHQLEQVTRRYATRTLAGPLPQQKPEAYVKELSDLSDSREKLERQLAVRSAAFATAKAQTQRTPADLARALPKDTVLVDFLEYTHRTPSKEKKGQWDFERRLLAFVLQPDGAVKRVELKAGADIQQVANEWLAQINAGQFTLGSKAGARMRELLWQPLEPHLGGAKQVIISPDGVICQLPLGALPGSRPGTYLLEDMALVVVAIPRLLPELLADRQGKNSVPPSMLTLGDVTYGATPGEQPKVVETMVSRAAPIGEGQRNWEKLGATRDEILAAADSFRNGFGRKAEVADLRDGEATEGKLREEAPLHTYLHLATHGYFDREWSRKAKQAEERRHKDRGLSSDESFGTDRDTFLGMNPDLLSGLVLAGANRPPQEGHDDGIMTALEVAALDLRKVELAVLSACETGLGDSFDGEGLLGLQRAFQVAGARTTVASLWKVPDRATQALMSEFYENMWKKKMPKLEALRQAQLTMLREGGTRGVSRKNEAESESDPKRLPPMYWAAFVLSGDWR